MKFYQNVLGAGIQCLEVKVKYQIDTCTLQEISFKLIYRITGIALLSPNESVTKLQVYAKTGV